MSRLHGIFGAEQHVSYADTRPDQAKPFNPKHLRYEVFGGPGTQADISYFDANGDPQHLNAVTLPWSLEFPIGAATAVGNVIAQGNTDNLGCRILLDDVVKSEKISHEVSAFAFCLMKSA